MRGGFLFFHGQVHEFYGGALLCRLLLCDRGLPVGRRGGHSWGNEREEEGKQKGVPCAGLITRVGREREGRGKRVVSSDGCREGEGVRRSEVRGEGIG